MQLFVKTHDGTQSLFFESTQMQIGELKEEIASRLSIQSQYFYLTHQGRCLNELSTAEESGLHNGSSIHLIPRLPGGGNREWMSMKDKELAFKHNVDKMVCRRCYARLPPKATQCRKKDCRSTDIRKKSNNPNK
ncbi:unnamed protein product, partial [Mesorhabditis belari]|uniref:Ubiquitin-ribosomal protein eL40 fusion protein n=1 Tax=Mesorhabditis belari TaxID=2138241 RepID=A0AAF3EPA7_9BILA